MLTYDLICKSHFEHLEQSLIKHIALTELEYFGDPANNLAFGDPIEGKFEKPSKKFMSQLQLPTLNAVSELKENTLFVYDTQWIDWNTARLNYGTIYSGTNWAETRNCIFRFDGKKWTTTSPGDKYFIGPGGCEF